MKITILDDSSAKTTCEGHCGTDWSSAEELALARRRIGERFGSGIRLDYLDLSKEPGRGESLELKEMVEREKTSLPLLLVNSQPRISGQFDMRQLLDVIEAEMEVKRE